MQIGADHLEISELWQEPHSQVSGDAGDKNCGFKRHQNWLCTLQMNAGLNRRSRSLLRPQQVLVTLW
jgi:hypothetical protein